MPPAEAVTSARLTLADVGSRAVITLPDGQTVRGTVICVNADLVMGDRTNAPVLGFRADGQVFNTGGVAGWHLC